MFKNHASNHKHQGFSLLEMLCVCIIVAILSILMFPSYQQIIAQSYTKQALAALLHKENMWLQQSLQTGQSLSEIAYKEAWPQFIAKGHYQLNFSGDGASDAQLSMQASENQQRFDPCSPWYVDQNLNIRSRCKAS